jgi:hypothetical protein
MGSLFHKKNLITENETRAYNLGFPRRHRFHLIIYFDMVISLFAGVFAVINFFSNRNHKVFVNFKYFFLIWSFIKVLKQPWTHETICFELKDQEISSQTKEINQIIEEIDYCETSKEQIKLLKIIEEKLKQRSKLIDEIKKFKDSACIELKEIRYDKNLMILNSSFSFLVTLFISCTPNIQSLQRLAFATLCSINLLFAYSSYRTKKYVQQFIIQTSEEESEDCFSLDSNRLPTLEVIKESIEKIQKENKLIKYQDVKRNVV